MSANGCKDPFNESLNITCCKEILIQDQTMGKRRAKAKRLKKEK